MDNTQTTFDQAYWASQPPEVRALPGIQDQDARNQRAVELAVKGYTIDVPIMCWNWDPYLVMKLREDYHYTWVPSALQPPPTIAPGIQVPGVPPYDPNHPPPGSIRVSTNPADYPPWTAPTPVSTPDPVGPLSIGNLYFDASGGAHIDGEKITESRGTFLMHIIMTPFGPQRYWEKIG